MSQTTGKMLKKEFNATNMTVYFGSALFTTGVTGISNLFLKYYREAGINDSEMMLIIQLIRLRNEEHQLMPSVETLAGCLAADPIQIERQIKSLLDKKVIGITKYFIDDAGTVVEGYDFEPLVFVISEIWALSQKRELDMIADKINSVENKENGAESGSEIVLSSQEQDLCHAFESEFGRLLSPMEIEQILAWIEEHRLELIYEALRQAVMRGKHNFKYIGSILLEWKKNNIQTIEAVNEYQRRFKENRAKQNQKKVDLPATQRIDQKKKTLMRSMYS